ncbi:MAG: pectate lyase, partial [Prevotella sp.]|nr:pectate lyase [Prevotella sp.]
TIVCDASVTIQRKSALKLKENTTLAGQTAPGDGICIAGYQVTLAKNNIIRYLRFRPGDENGGEPDGLGAMDSENIIVDHCSVSWSVDECLSVYGSKNTTVQWCIASQSLCNSTHVKKAHGYGGNWGGSGASYHHNLIAHHVSRTPRLGPRPGTQTDERMDMRNNVIYNWIDNGVYGGEGMNVNIVNNYYKPTAATKKGAKGMRIAAPGIRTSEYTAHNTAKPNDWDKMWHVWGKYYVDGNVNTMYPEVTKDNWTYGIYNQIDANGNDGTYTEKTKDTIRINTPIYYEAVTTHTAEKAYEQVLKYVGASLHRDALDEIIVSDTRDGKCTFTASGNSKGIIDHPSDVKGDGWEKWPTLVQTEAKPDTDGDGMPDEWETANGLNPNDKSDGNAIGEGGYTNLEIYMNSIVADITEKQNEGGELWSGQQTTTAIEAIKTERPNSSGAIYTLQGVRTTNLTKGIYIQNGKKFIIK